MPTACRFCSGWSRGSPPTTPPWVLGVVGMDRSTAETAWAVGKLGDLGVPVVATTLSVDGLEAASPMFFQSVPSNWVQARLIADYVEGARYPSGGLEAGQRRYDRVLVYYPKVADDLYVNTLVCDLNAELDRRGVPRDSRSWDVHRLVLDGRGLDGCPAGTKNDTEVWTPPDR
ncbi:hypothetical protein ACIBG0_16455 [Nocardia sp. NPDC050630]|uniref:hypothetical protein n=1 Tax=Nocardia sp. NPDC050630 TaxID=3364321 RepID=UPI0037AD162F